MAGSTVSALSWCGMGAALMLWHCTGSVLLPSWYYCGMRGIRQALQVYLPHVAIGTLLYWYGIELASAVVYGHSIGIVCVLAGVLSCYR